ncbi:MAG TPA: RES family NAD+ phosphorylase [Rhodocyclaceae bacterium]
MQRVWRIATNAPTYKADDLSGTGAKITGGRWNSVNVPVVYCAGSIALATLETVVHLEADDLPLNRYLVAVDIPPAVWKRRETYTDKTAPPGWDAVPAALTSTEFGDEWVMQQRSAVIELPSVIVPDELNVLINPAHPDAKKIKATIERKWLYDSRLLKPATPTPKKKPAKKP